MSGKRLFWSMFVFFNILMQIAMWGVIIGVHSLITVQMNAQGNAQGMVMLIGGVVLGAFSCWTLRKFWRS